MPFSTLVGRFGRKKTIITHMLLGGVGCFTVSFIPAGTDRIGKYIDENFVYSFLLIL